MKGRVDSKLDKLYIKLKTCSGFSWNIHFWLGNETTTDEQFVAAYKSVELDDALDGSPVEYRECQGRESPLFLSYFKELGSLVYLSGGVSSGLTSVTGVEDAEKPPKLFQIKGKHVARISIVAVKNSSVNCNDVYVLDAYDELFLYNGREASIIEKAKGLDFMLKLRSEERGGKSQITLLDDEPKNEKFWSLLGGYIDVSDTVPAQSDEDFSEAAKSSTRVYRVLISSEDDVKFIDETSQTGILTKDLLQTDNMYLVDTASILYVWVGHGVSTDARKKSMVNAMHFLGEEKKHASQIPITRVVEEAESVLFKSLFKSWESSPFSESVQQKPATLSKNSSGHDVDVVGLVNGGHALRPEEQNEGESSIDTDVELKIWRIENLEKVEVPSEFHGVFYGGDSYVIMCSRMLTLTHGSQSRKSLIYFWQGRQSSTDEKTASAMIAVQLGEEVSNASALVRVVQGKEPSDFRRLFKGRMIVRKGGKVRDVLESEATPPENLLFHVRGTTEANIMATEVEPKASNLYSGDCFIVKSTEQTFVWRGSGSSEMEYQVSCGIAEQLQKTQEIKTINENEESDEFWDILGGQSTPTNAAFTFDCPRPSRLFHCTNISGYFDATEIVDFAQDDLTSDDVFLLDTYAALYIWIGKNANKAEVQSTYTLADKYLQTVHSDGRGDDIPVIATYCGCEPLTFKGHFVAWDDQYFEQDDYIDPYQTKLKKLAAEKEKLAAEKEEIEAEKEKVAAGKVSAKKEEDIAKKEEFRVKKEALSVEKEKVSVKKEEKANGVFVKGQATVEPNLSMESADNAQESSTSGRVSGDRNATAKSSYSYEQLLAGVDNIDLTARESYLSEEEFEKVFQISRANYNKLPKWKQQAKKKEVNLF
uniref:Villinlike protein putative n=1 Tax=Albugo laibachii Nc14 TaxID=890382 RepID=F0W1I1_9STRA|nr:villinlike protein putative [Albugo laibachii Nc14]|eukprot:CCA14910.1 villinlike protein putative [Albugo laibachii Nc14]